MPRALSTKTETAIDKTVTQPLYFVYIGYGTPLYYSSGPSITLGDYLQDELEDYLQDELSGYLQGDADIIWTPKDMLVTVSPDRNEGTLKIGNTDYAFGEIVLATTIADVPIKIYAFYYGDSPYDASDAELLFDGVGSGVDLDTRWVTVSLEKGSTGVMFSPRIKCTKEMGFNHLPVDGMTISWGGEQYILEVRE